MHTENGFVKVFSGEDKKSAEACYSHPFGMNEIEYGTLEDNTLILEASDESNFQRSKSGSNSAQAMKVTGIWRKFSAEFLPVWNRTRLR